MRGWSSWDHKHKHDWITEDRNGKWKSDKSMPLMRTKTNKHASHQQWGRFPLLWVNDLLIFFETQPLVSKSYKCLSVCHWKIGKTDKLTTYSALSMTHERWMHARMYEGLYSIYKEWKELFHSSQLACSILHIWNKKKLKKYLFSQKSNGKYKWWYVNIRINIHTGPHLTTRMSVRWLKDQKHIHRIPRESSVVKAAANHRTSYLGVSDTLDLIFAPQMWIQDLLNICNLYTNESSGGLNQKDQSSAAPSEAPSVSLWRVSAFSSSALRVWG